MAKERRGKAQAGDKLRRYTVMAHAEGCGEIQHKDSRDAAHPPRRPPPVPDIYRSRLCRRAMEVENAYRHRADKTPATARAYKIQYTYK